MKIPWDPAQWTSLEILFAWTLLETGFWNTFTWDDLGLHLGPTWNNILFEHIWDDLWLYLGQCKLEFYLRWPWTLHGVRFKRNFNWNSVQWILFKVYFNEFYLKLSSISFVLEIQFNEPYLGTISMNITWDSVQKVLAWDPLQWSLLEIIFNGFCSRLRWPWPPDIINEKHE